MNRLMKISNAFIGLLLRSPLHGLMSKSTLMISFTGRKSNRSYTTPVNYAQQGKLIRITSQRNRQWWRNLRGQKKNGTATVQTDQPGQTQSLAAFIKTAPQMARYFKVSFDENGDPNPEDLALAAKERIVIEISLGE